MANHTRAPAPAPRGVKTSSWTLEGSLRVMNDEGADAGPIEALAHRFAITRRSPANTLGVSMATGAVESKAHSHRAAHLFYVVRGEFRCEASGAWWIVPPQSALWVPGHAVHRIQARAPLEGYNVFLDPDAAPHMPTECCAVSVSPLLRELMLRLATRPVLHDLHGPDARLVAVLVDELAHVSMEQHRLPMPREPRLRKLVDEMTRRPSDRSDRSTWAKRVGLGERTLNRLLVRETGLSFGRWRQQLHIVLAIQRLSRGASVQSVASDLGYESASSFVTMFRKALGTSPARYMAERRPP